MRRFLLFLMVFLLLMSGANGQALITIAGGGKSNPGDGGMATAASLNNPYGIAVAVNGDVYFADRNNHKVRKVSKEGILTTIAGTGVAGYSGDGKSATKARLDYPISVALDGKNNLYISDRYNNCVRKVELTSGVISTIAGNGKAGFSGEGDLARDAQLNGPAGIMIDRTGRILVCDAYNNCIRMINESGEIITIAGTGNRGEKGDGGPAAKADITEPYGICGDAAGNIFFTEFGICRVRRIDTLGKISTLAGIGKPGFGGDGGPATNAVLNRPTGVAVDNQGVIYVADGDNNRIRRIDREGIISTVVGSSYLGNQEITVSAKLFGPAGIAIDTGGTIFFTDLGNNRIRAFRPNFLEPGTIEEKPPLEVYADPTEMTLEFRFPASRSFVVKLMESDGRLREMKSAIAQPNVIFSIVGYKPGIYRYEVLINDKKESGIFRVE